jgi:hypothetical protein
LVLRAAQPGKTLCRREAAAMIATIAEIVPKPKKLLRMLSFEQPGEVVSAAYAIGRMLRTAGADWHDLAAQLLVPMRTHEAIAAIGTLCRTFASSTGSCCARASSNSSPISLTGAATSLKSNTHGCLRSTRAYGARENENLVRASPLRRQSAWRRAYSPLTRTCTRTRTCAAANGSY